METETFGKAKDQQMLWKSADIIRYAYTFVAVAVNHCLRNLPYTGSDDMPPELTVAGRGIAGSAISMLRNAHIIEDYYGTHPEQGIHHGRRRSKRPERNGAKVNLFSLTSLAAAEEFLRRYSVDFEPQQKELPL